MRLRSSNELDVRMAALARYGRFIRSRRFCMDKERKSLLLGLRDRRKSLVSVSHSVNHHHWAIKKFNKTQAIRTYKSEKSFPDENKRM